MDGKLPEISVLDSNCLMAEEFGILFTQAKILTSGNGYAVRALDLGLNPEAFRALGKTRKLLFSRQKALLTVDGVGAAGRTPVFLCPTPLAA